MKKLIAIVLVLMAPSLLCAAPSVNGVSGTIADGQSITISGMGFGSTGPTVLLFDDYEFGTTNAYIGDGATDAVIGEWLNCGVGCSPIYFSTYSTNYAHGGTKSARQDWTTDLQEGARWMGVNFSSTYQTKIYFSFWTLLPTGLNTPSYGAGANWKVWWLYGVNNITDDYASEITSSPPSATTIGWVDGSQNRICYPTSCAEYGSFSFTRGTWIRWEGYLVASTTAGQINLWHTDSTQARNLFGSNTGRTIDNGSQGWVNFHIPGFGRADVNSNTYYDDVYIAVGDGAQARVEIGNNATYSSCTNLAVCTPTSWADTSITAVVRAGSFTTGTAYLFVVDSSGAVSSGKEITLGGESSTPAPPTISNVTISNGRVQ